MTTLSTPASSQLVSLGITPGRIVSALTLVAVPLGAALGFVIQPALGKALLPLLGGTAATWLGAALFFQAALLLGYAWGLWLGRLGTSGQFTAQLILAAVAILTFHLPDGHEGLPSLAGVFFSLTTGCLPAMMLLFGLSPWVQQLRERLELPEPYALYAFSNLGSLLALLLYPFAIEPYFGLSAQIDLWKALFYLVSALIVSTALALWKLAPLPHPREDVTSAVPAGPGLFPPARVLSWLALSALPCVVIMAASSLIAAEIGSVPMAWVGPLGVYLAAFALVFSGRWRPWQTGATMVCLGLSLTAYMVQKGFGSATIDGFKVVLLVLVCAFASLLAIALLHSSRPSRGGAWFYLAIAVGGVLGGLVSLFVVPHFFSRPVEFPVMAALVLAAGLLWATKWRHPGAVFGCITLALGPVFIIGMPQAREDRMGNGVITHHRDIYGHLMLKTDSESVVLSSATTTHGTQLNATPEARLRPTSYFTESSAIARAIRSLQAERPAMRIAVIGLGAGTLATYTRPGDEMVFYDIDPKIEMVARTYFTYLRDAKGAVSVRLVDGRRILAEASQGDFDIVVMDAFMGDGVPPHLLTREALEIYHERLRTRDGLLVVNGSLRYSNIFPFLAATAKTLDLESIGIQTDIAHALENRDWDAASSNYVVIGTPARIESFAANLPLEEEEGRVKRSITRLTSLLAGPRNTWTDDRNASLDALNLSLWLTGR